jgi:hypothetical protein
MNHTSQVVDRALEKFEQVASLFASAAEALAVDINKVWIVRSHHTYGFVCRMDVIATFGCSFSWFDHNVLHVVQILQRLEPLSTPLLEYSAQIGRFKAAAAAATAAAPNEVH